MAQIEDGYVRSCVGIPVETWERLKELASLYATKKGTRRESHSAVIRELIDREASRKL